MKNALIVFVGGGFGSVLRYLFGKWLNHWENSLPYGTLLANIIGSLIIGFVLGYVSRASSMSDSHTLLWATGFCGGFTTFSAFAYENQLYLKAGDYLNFSIYTIGSIVLGLAAVFVGLYLAKLI